MFSPYKVGEDAVSYTQIATAICEEAKMKYATEQP